jgi:hypothetical protein
MSRWPSPAIASVTKCRHFGDFRNIRLQRDGLHAERPHFGGERLGFGDPAVIIDCEVSAFLPPMQCGWRARYCPAANAVAFVSPASDRR